jgi:hypothetical protein
MKVSTARRHRGFTAETAETAEKTTESNSEKTLPTF